MSETPPFKRNRAKCRLCHTIIESMAIHDKVMCPCGEIAIDGGPLSPDGLRWLESLHWENLIVIDDEGNEVNPTVVKKDGTKVVEEMRGDKQSPLDMVNSLIARCESLPQDAMMQYLTQYDYLSLLYLMKAMIG